MFFNLLKIIEKHHLNHNYELSRTKLTFFRRANPTVVFFHSWL